ncbi:PIN domain-containing protein [Halorussus salilacus]|uniref:PIN domain-containing protein n=1 Tax=Halorussus salilacus TaxID=2953750 RepID=UPI0020A05261|nr:PIN domain-containing protein [Halorussus salilacus]USZ66865.1 PIN domain-containing protein [Halorussus salilacus]
MSESFAFDAEPLVAYLYDEPGSDRVERILGEVYDGETDAMMSEVTATEIAYKTAWIHAEDRPSDDDLELGRRQVRNFVDGGIELVSPTDSWETAAAVKMQGGIALGDAFAVALAAERGATLLVGADDDFEDVPVSVEIEGIRTEPAT